MNSLIKGLVLSCFTGLVGLPSWAAASDKDCSENLSRNPAFIVTQHGASTDRVRIVPIGNKPEPIEAYDFKFARNDFSAVIVPAELETPDRLQIQVGSGSEVLFEVALEKESAAILAAEFIRVGEGEGHLRLELPDRMYDFLIQNSGAQQGGQN